MHTRGQVHARSEEAKRRCYLLERRRRIYVCPHERNRWGDDGANNTRRRVSGAPAVSERRDHTKGGAFARAVPGLRIRDSWR